MKRVLGRGLNTLVPDSYIDSNKKNEVVPINKPSEGILNVPVDRLVPSKEQPRKYFKDAMIDDLAASIREKGILQPLVVSLTADGNYEIICGERRFRAAQKAGLDKVPVIVKDFVGSQALEVALIENIQREDLNPIEEAQAYQRLQDESGYSHETIAIKVGKDRATISNALRILKLPVDILDLVMVRKISGGHARALLGVEGEDAQRYMAQRIVSEGLSVRQTEKLVQQKAFRKRKPKQARRLDAEVVHLEALVQQKLGTKVKIFSGKRNNGRLEIQYNSLDELDRILELMGVYRESV